MAGKKLDHYGVRAVIPDWEPPAEPYRPQFGNTGWAPSSDLDKVTYQDQVGKILSKSDNELDTIQFHIGEVSSLVESDAKGLRDWKERQPSMEEKTAKAQWQIEDDHSEKRQG